MISIILSHKGVERIEVPCDGRLELHATTLLLSAPEIATLHEKCRSRMEKLQAVVEADGDEEGSGGDKR